MPRPEITLCLCWQAVTVEGTGFTNRLGLPEPWRGVRDEALTKISGIADCCFCHAVRTAPQARVVRTNNLTVCV